jgi:murein DD-endopeptidase MepM/ murein hydrolase activator NlpD
MKEIKLAGILYLHRITDAQMVGTPLKNLQMFQKLCGKDALHHVILVTTMWDNLMEGGETGELLQKRLESKYWKEMIDAGSTVCRYNNSPNSAWEILRQIVDGQFASLIQEESVVMRRELGETIAGRTLYLDLENLVKEQIQELQYLREENKGYKKAFEDLQNAKTRGANDFDKQWTAKKSGLAEEHIVTNQQRAVLRPTDERNSTMQDEKESRRREIETGWEEDEKKLKLIKEQLDGAARECEALQQKISSRFKGPTP